MFTDRSPLLSVRLVIDFIPNHTSRNHTWFMKSQQKEDPYTNYYIWAPCSETDPKPSTGGDMVGTMYMYLYQNVID